MTKVKKNKKKAETSRPQVRKRFKEFFITINPMLGTEADKELDWNTLTDEQCSEKCKEIRFPTHEQFKIALESLGDGICLDGNNNTVNMSFKTSSERGSENGKPHYHAVVFCNKVTTVKQIVGHISELLYGEISCPQIDVQPTINYEAAALYVVKKPWQIANSDYAFGTWNSLDEKRLRFIKDYPDAKKSWKHLGHGSSF